MKIAKKFELEKNPCTTHLLEFIDKLCKYELDSAGIVDDTE